MRADDLVLHYLTTSLTKDRRLQSRMVGVSRVTSPPILTSKTITAPCVDTVELPTPVRYTELQQLVLKEGPLKQLIGMRMQRYLTQITESDFTVVIEAKLENSRRFRTSPLRGFLSA